MRCWVVWHFQGCQLARDLLRRSVPTMVNEGIEITVIDGETYVGTVEIVAVPIVVGGGCFQDLKADVSLVSYNKKLESVQVANVVQESAHFCGCLVTQY